MSNAEAPLSVEELRRFSQIGESVLSAVKLFGFKVSNTKRGRPKQFDTDGVIRVARLGQRVTEILSHLQAK